jgi:4-amino-4-deoxy-L-arabinose transferase-like glycosyltransferase
VGKVGAMNRASPLPIFTFAGLVCLCAVIRLPFFVWDSGDDVFFMQGAHLWLSGHLPYVASFDIKPPGVFAAFLLPVLCLGNSLETLRAVMVLGDALTAFALYDLGRRMGDRWIGVWAAAIYPVLSVIVFNNSAYAVLAPAVVGGVLMAVVSEGRKPSWIAASGLALGLACMVKQTCVLETVVVAICLATRPDSRGERPGRQGLGAAAWFCVWAALPGLGFSLYFASHHALGALLTDSIKLALARSGGGPEGLGPWASLTRFVRLQRYVVAPLGLSALALLRWKQVRARLPTAPLGLLASWLGAGALAVLLQHASYPGYLAAEAPPLLLLSGAGLTVALDELKRAASPWRVLGAAALTSALVYGYSRPDEAVWEDMPAQRQIASTILAQPPNGDDGLFVVNRGLWVYALTGRDPPTAYYHPMHTLCDFPGAGRSALAQALEARPRFIVVADPSVHFACERPERWAAIGQTLQAHYRKLAHVTGRRDRFDLYEVSR